MAALEAMAAGVPVLISEHVGLAPEIVQSCAGSILPQDPRVWAETIDQLLNDPAAREKMGRAGKELVQQKFSSESIARSMVHVYHSLMEQHGSGH